MAGQADAPGADFWFTAREAGRTDEIDRNLRLFSTKTITGGPPKSAAPRPVTGSELRERRKAR